MCDEYIQIINQSIRLSINDWPMPRLLDFPVSDVDDDLYEKCNWGYCVKDTFLSFCGFHVYI